jgi:hypothetical protein
MENEVVEHERILGDEMQMLLRQDDFGAFRQMEIELFLTAMTQCKHAQLPPRQRADYGNWKSAVWL